MPHITHPLLSLSASIILTLSVTACASGPNRGGPPSSGGSGPMGSQNSAPEFEGTLAEPIGLLFVAMDTDKNGATSRAELSNALPAQWASLQGRGTIGAIVFSDWSLANLGSTEARPTFLAFDANFSSSISRTEFENRIELEFDRLDANSDDKLTRAELIKVISRPQARQQSGRSQSGGGEQRGGGGQGGPDRGSSGGAGR